MNKEAYGLGIELAAVDAGLVKEADIGSAILGGTLRSALRRRGRGDGPPEAQGSLLGGVAGLYAGNKLRPLLEGKMNPKHALLLSLLGGAGLGAGLGYGIGHAVGD